MWKYKAILTITLLVFTLSLITPGIAYANEGTGGMEVEVNGYHVRLVFPSPAKIGENDFHIQITSPDGSPVSGAEVEAAAQPVEKTEQHEADMGNAHGHDPAPPVHDDGMSGMDMGGTNDALPTATPESMDSHGTQSLAIEPITVALQAGHEAGEYSGTIAFPQAGHWMLVVDFMVGGETLRAEFPLEVVSDIPASYGIVAGFFGLNVAIVAAAAVTKRKAIRA